MTDKKIQQLQLIEQSFQNILVQKQTFQSQLLEVESALSELGKTKKAYRIIGNVMVESEKSDLLDELKQKKEVAELRIKALDKQESQIREKAEKIRTDVLKDMKEKA